MSILVVILALGVVQLALALHVRNTLLSSAHEGARLAAHSDRSFADGEARTAQLLETALGGNEVEISSRPTVIQGSPGVVVEVTSSVPLIGMWGVGTMTVEARAYQEVPRG